jgi:hypothetical protein
MAQNDFDRDEEEKEDGYEMEAPESQLGWVNPAANPESVFIETGRGNAIEATVGVPFIPTVEEAANRANYGGYFRVFVNSQEIINQAEAPATIETGMRITITGYDKVG